MGINHLYIHVPFCKAICYYCDFCHRVYDEKLAERWLDRLSREAEENCKDQYETIYIGGGTPTTLNDTQLKRLLEMIDPFAERVTEYTIECIWPWRGHPLIGLLSPPLCAFRSENFLPYVKVGGQGY